MSFLQNHLLTLIIFLPTLGAVLTLIARTRDAARWTAVAPTPGGRSLWDPVIVPF